MSIVLNKGFAPLPKHEGIINKEFLTKTINPVKALAKTLVAFATPLFVSACGNNVNAQQNPPVSSPNQQPSSSATKINVTETEMAINVSSATAPTGPIDFVIHNSGKIPHEFVVFKTSVPDNKLPLKGSNLDESGQGIKHIAEIGADQLKSGATKTLNVNLPPGRYVLVCNIPGHFMAGMKTDFTVK